MSTALQRITFFMRASEDGFEIDPHDNSIKDVTDFPGESNEVVDVRNFKIFNPKTGKVRPA